MGMGRAAEQVRPDQVGDVARPGGPRHLTYGAGLCDPTALQHDQAIRQRDRVEQFVRHEHPRTGERREMGPQVASQFRAGTDVECGQWLVEQEQAGLRDEGTGQRHPLLLSP